MRLFMNGKGYAQKIIAFVLLGFSVFYLISGLKYKLGTYKIMGPGFFPLIIGVLLVGCTGFHLLRAFGFWMRRTEEPEAAVSEIPAEKGSNYAAIAGIVVCTTAYPFVLEYLKFVTSTFLVGMAMLTLLKPRSVVFSFLLSAGMALACFLVFSRLLGVSLPSGPLEDLLYRIGG